MLAVIYISLLMNSCLLVCVSGEKEYLSHGVHHPVHEEHYADGQHNMEFDHEAVLGSQRANQEFEELPPHEAKKRLASMVDAMDVDKDGYVSLDELTNWIGKSFITLNREEAKQKMSSQDLDNDTRVTWEEYLQSVYGNKPDDLDDMEKDENPQIRTFVEMVNEDKERFKRADVYGINKLDSDTYAAFLHPYDYPHMREYELDRVLKDYDKNNDKVVDYLEYIGENPGSKEQQIVDQENFAYYDQNKDGQLDREEVRQWIMPDLKNAAVDEAEHLMHETDLNHDGKLSKQEILDQHLLWVGSSVTDYGNHLHHHDPQEL